LFKKEFLLDSLITWYTLFRYALYTVVTHVSYANYVTRFIRRQYTYDVTSFLANVVISRTVFRQCIFYQNYWKFQYRSYKQMRHVVHR